jgi:RsiW-degrading membrane proteinase PrsW (M82 family)
MSSILDGLDQSYSWILILLIVIIFTFLTILFYYSRDKYEPEPMSKIFLAFGLGILSIIPALLLSLIVIFYVPQEILQAVFVAPIVEEFCKAWMVVYLSKNDNFDGPLDGLIYGAMVGSGFAFAENLLYGFTILYSPDGGVFLGLTITTFRSLTQVIGHPLYTGLFGVGVGEVKVGLASGKYQKIWRSIALHAMWNGAASLPNYSFFGGIAFVIIISIIKLKTELTTAILLDRQAYESGYYEAKRLYLEEQQRRMTQPWLYQQQPWGQQPPQRPWGQQPPQQPWGQQPPQQPWGQQPPQQPWGQQPPQQPWGQQSPQQQPQKSMKNKNLNSITNSDLVDNYVFF